MTYESGDYSGFPGMVLVGACRPGMITNFSWRLDLLASHLGAMGWGRGWAGELQWVEPPAHTLDDYLSDSCFLKPSA